MIPHAKKWSDRMMPHAKKWSDRIMPPSKKLTDEMELFNKKRDDGILRYIKKWSSRMMSHAKKWNNRMMIPEKKWSDRIMPPSKKLSDEMELLNKKWDDRIIAYVKKWNWRTVPSDKTRDVRVIYDNNTKWGDWVMPLEKSEQHRLSDKKWDERIVPVTEKAKSTMIMPTNAKKDGEKPFIDYDNNSESILPNTLQMHTLSRVKRWSERVFPNILETRRSYTARNTAGRQSTGNVFLHRIMPHTFTLARHTRMFWRSPPGSI
jgi:gas vesicle protein